MTTDEERDLAVTARRGGRYLVRHAHARAWDPNLLADAMALAAPTGTAAMLPEAAFDWPIYRAALAPQSGTFAAIDPTETFEPDGPPDSYWSAADDSRYRRDMRDAGRGHLLRW